MERHLLHSIQAFKDALSTEGGERLMCAQEKMLEASMRHAEKIEARKQRMQESIENGAKLTRHRLPLFG